MITWLFNLCKLALLCAPLIVAHFANQSRLHDAAARGDIVAILAALKPWKDINGLDRNGRSALALAIERKQDAAAIFLIQRGAAAVYPGGPRWARQPLDLIVARGDANLGSALLQRGQDPNSRLANGRTWLVAVVERRDGEMVKQLLAAGADVNLAGAASSPTPLQAALSDSFGPGGFGAQSVARGVAIAETLVAAGARVTVDAQTERALRSGIAILGQPPAAVGLPRLKFLIEHGYPLEPGTPGGGPLQAAAMMGNPEAVEYLLAKGADPSGGTPACGTPVCSANLTPLHVAVFNRPDARAGDRYRRVVQMLLAAGADPDARDRNGRTPRELAIQHENLDLADLLQAASATRAAIVRGETGANGVAAAPSK